MHDAVIRELGFADLAMDPGAACFAHAANPSTSRTRHDAKSTTKLQSAALADVVHGLPGDRDQLCRSREPERRGALPAEGARAERCRQRLAARRVLLDLRRL